MMKPTTKPGSSNLNMKPAGMAAQTITTAVTANPHHFQSAPVSQSNYQNGVGGASDGHVIMPKSHDPQDSQSQQLEQTSQSSNLANTKEKTPMCLINELARFNKVTHQYTLVDEQGPAHKKNFYVKLQLGEKEEYSASGPSIKKAQHAAAAEALEKTEFKHPPPKVPRSYMHPGLMQDEIIDASGDGLNTMTPTVELNTLAMKRGEPALYKSLENRNPHPVYYPHNYDFRGMYNQRYHYMKPPRIYYVSLKVGSREFIGEGNTRQAARHCAATKALEILRNLPMPDIKPKKEGEEGEKKEKKSEEKEEDEEVKSEISIVHELALRLNMPVSFEVTKESGPPHMKNFITQCTVGTMQTEADGNSKKLSKRRAAELMLAELKKLPQLPAIVVRPKTKPAANKKKNRNLIKVSEVQKGDPTYGVGINPISRLIQIQQAQKKKEPVYTLLAERGMPRRREFVMQVLVDEETCTGVGPNKKLAKRHAAEAMLLHLGYNKPSPQPAKPAIKSTESTNGDKKVHFVENSEENGPTAAGAGSRQMVPGLLVLPEGNRTMGNYTQIKGLGNQFNSGATLLNGSGYGMRPELKLREVAARYNIEVKFDEFAGKNNTNEYLSRVVVASNPQHTLHGSGPTPEASRDAASLTALKILTEMGVIKEEKLMAGGDAPHMKTTVG